MGYCKVGISLSVLLVSQSHHSPYLLFSLSQVSFLLSPASHQSLSLTNLLTPYALSHQPFSLFSLVSHQSLRLTSLLIPSSVSHQFLSFILQSVWATSLLLLSSVSHQFP